MLTHDETLSEKFVKKGSWIFLFTLLTAPLGYLIRIILTGDLSVEEIGILYWVIWLLGLLQVYNDFWLTESLNYFLPKYIVTKDYARCKYLLVFSFWVQLCTSIFLALFLFFLADFLAVSHFKNPIAKEVIQVMSLFFVGSNLLQISTILFSVSQNTKLQKGLDFFRIFMTALGIFIISFASSGTILHYAWVWIISIFVTIFFAFSLSYKYYYLPYFKNVKMEVDHSLRRTFIKYSLGTFLTANIGTLLHQLDQQILQWLTTATEGGIYAMYLSLVGIPFIFLGPIILFLFPVISEINSRWEFDKIRKIHGLFSSVISVFMLWASGLFCILGVTLAVFLYGPNYMASGSALYFIAPFLVLNILLQINFQIMAWIGMVRQRITIFTKTLIFNVIVMISMILAFKYNIIPFPSASSAASFSVGVSWILMWYLSYRVVKEYTWPMDWNSIWKNILAIIFLIGFFFLLRQNLLLPIFEPNGKIGALSEILFVFFISIAIFLLLNFKKWKEFLSIVQTVRKKK